MKRKPVLATSLLTLLIAGCGGGDSILDDIAGLGEPDLVDWTDNANGSTVKDADNDSLAFTTEGVLYRDEVSYPGVKVRASDAAITWNGSVIGTVALQDSTTPGAKVAVTLCTSGVPLNFTFLDGRVEYNCVTPQSSGSGTVSSSGGNSNNGSGLTFVNWTGNSLEYLVKDADNDYYVVDAASRRLMFVGSKAEGPVRVATPTPFANTQVDGKANIVIDNVVAGYITLGTSAAGTSLAVTKCVDGRDMSLFSDPASATVGRYQCAGQAGGAAPPGSGGGGGSSYNFTSFTGSGNGICIIDNSGDCFAIDSRTKLLSFLGPVQSVNINDQGATPSRTYGNARGIFQGNTLVGLSVDGQRLANVNSVPLSVRGLRGPAFLCTGGDLAEIYENPAKAGDALLRCSGRSPGS